MWKTAAVEGLPCVLAYQVATFSSPSPSPFIIESQREERGQMPFRIDKWTLSSWNEHFQYLRLPPPFPYSPGTAQHSTGPLSLPFSLSLYHFSFSHFHLGFRFVLLLLLCFPL